MDEERAQSPSQARGARVARWVAWTTLGIIVSTIAVCAALGDVGATVFPVLMLPFPVVGAIVAARRPRNPIGWIMLAIGGVAALEAPLSVYAGAGLRDTASAWSPAVAMTLRASLWVPILGLIGTFLVLLFPDGHLPSRGWRWIAWLSAATLAACWVLIVLSPATFADYGFPDVRNPLAVDAVGAVAPVLFPPLLAALPLCMIACALSLVLRYRSARGAQRLQLKWLAAAAATAAFVYLVTMLADLPYALSDTAVPPWIGVLRNVGPLAFLLIPPAIGVAMLRHRLYDIDVIINRALVYGVLTLALTLAYLALVTALQMLLQPVAGHSDLAVAASTLVIAAAFRPARVRVQRFIDRHFYRRRYDAVRTLSAFSQRLRADHDVRALRTEIAGVVDRVMQPSHVSLWMPSQDHAARR
jgi:hypothetical protein